MLHRYFFAGSSFARTVEYKVLREKNYSKYYFQHFSARYFESLYILFIKSCAKSWQILFWNSGYEKFDKDLIILWCKHWVKVVYNLDLKLWNLWNLGPRDTKFVHTYRYLCKYSLSLFRDIVLVGYFLFRAPKKKVKFIERNRNLVLTFSFLKKDSFSRVMNEYYRNVTTTINHFHYLS